LQRYLYLIKKAAVSELHSESDGGWMTINMSKIDETRKREK
jgi:hypothetical protein